MSILLTILGDRYSRFFHDDESERSCILSILSNQIHGVSSPPTEDQNKDFIVTLWRNREADGSFVYSGLSKTNTKCVCFVEITCTSIERGFWLDDPLEVTISKWGNPSFKQLLKYGSLKFYQDTRNLFCFYRGV